MEPLSTFLDCKADPEGSAELSGASLPQVQERRLRRVVEMIEAEPSCTIRTLARKVLLSPAHLQRLFKQQTGEQLGSLIAERRLQKAAQLLTSSNSSIKEIAHTVGYKHHSSFVRAFQRRFAQAPKRYRSQPPFASDARSTSVIKS
jgi:transcriptional regulator GlxA family with amidase domain